MIDLLAAQAGAGLDEEQRALQDALDRLLAGGADEAAFARFGAPAMLSPQDFGGHGLGVLEAAIVARLLGQHASPLPFNARHALAQRAILLAGNRRLQRQWLPAMASGERRLAASLRPHRGLFSKGGVLQGIATNVPEAEDSNAALLVDADGRAFLVPAQAGLRWTALETVDTTRRYADAQLEHAEAEPLQLHASAWRELGALDRLLHAGDSLGACESLLDRAVAYAKERRQFGRPIGSFQAIKHLCADLAAELELARSLFWRAARALDAGAADAALLCAQAKSQVDEAARGIARGAIEIHGAMGFTMASGLHAWANRTVVNRSLGDTPTRLRREIAQLSGWLG